MYILTTTSSVPGVQINQFMGIVHGIGIGKNAWGDAMGRLTDDATNIGANGIIGIAFDSVYTQGDGIVVHATGTAILVE